ncbi:hypothetical protein A9Q86_03300 [Flavobacteriales bacterium 33_180_T64]|nr:hypothetical protein A9Q86_03300 [Flavobacteriales bacterium 33_180_T64]
MEKVNSIEEYIEVNDHYAEELSILRSIIDSTELQETIKWNAPVYTLNGKNVVGLGAFKQHFGIWFFNGVFLKDQQKLLINAQENKTKALRQMRFKTKTDINEAAVLTYIKEAIENQRLGRELKPVRKSKEVLIPKELKDVLKSNTDLDSSFKSLTPGKQREYCEYIKDAKREATKQTRLEKITPMIIRGVGLHDKYKNC